MADERIEDISGGELTAIAADDKFVVLDKSDTTDDADGTVKYMMAKALGGLYRGSLIDGLVTSNNATDGDHDIDIAAGVATVTNGTTWSIASLASTLVKQIDASWAVGTNQGGLDTGTVAASTWYHVWLIMRSDTGVVDVLFSTSATAPTMPTNYDYKRRIGAVLTDGSSNIKSYSQFCDYFRWKVPVHSFNETVTVSTALTRSIDVPSVSSVLAQLRFDTASANTSAILITSTSDTDSAASNTWSDAIGGTVSGSSDLVPFRAEIIIPANTAQIRMRCSLAGSETISCKTLGWHDPRGRNT